MAWTEPKRRTRSWSPSLTDSGADTGLASGDEDSDDATVLFDACRFPRPTNDILDWVLDDEPWCEVETGSGVRIVGEADALKRLFSLPLSGTGKAICLHRLGNCLLVLDADEDAAEEDLESRSGFQEVSSTVLSPRSSAAARCQVRVEGDMVRVYPSTETAEPVDVAPTAATTPTAACCEWRVREGLSLVAVTPRTRVPGDGACGLADLRSTTPRLYGSGEPWVGSGAAGGDMCGLDLLATKGRSLPAYHQRVTEDRLVVLAVPLTDPVETEKLVDAWFSCCLMGSPSALCFFVDAGGICRGCRFVPIVQIPLLVRIAAAYHPDQRCLAAEAAAGTSEAAGAAFNPAVLRERSHALLEMLIAQCDHDGGHCVVLPSPLGLHFLHPPTAHQANCTDEDELEEVPGVEQALALCVDLREHITMQAQIKSDDLAAPRLSASTEELVELPKTLLRNRMQQMFVNQALVMYHAAVRLAQPHAKSTPGEVKGVPVGARWTAKSCRQPLRVRQMMLRTVRALKAANAVAAEAAEDSETGGDDGNAKGQTAASQSEKAPRNRRYLLLLASACEFLADSFLAEDSSSDEMLEISRYLGSLRHLRQSLHYLAEYMACPQANDSCEGFTQSVARLEDRVFAKQINAHLCLARLQQQRPWSEDIQENKLRCLGPALLELDEAEAVVSTARVTQPRRATGPHESSLLASISKWKADLLYELASLAIPAAIPGAQVELRLREYLEAQQQETQERSQRSQPLPVQCERWLQSTISLSLRGLHQLSALPSEMVGELQLQARARLAQAYGDLGRIYASTGRYTKAMTHAKQGIELFNATKDSLQAARLQLWLCRLQLRMAVPQAAPSVQAAGAVLEEPALLRGLSAVGAVEDQACTQVVQSLQRVLKVPEEGNEEEQALYQEGQTLLGRILLRQSLTRLASLAPLCSICRLCEEDSALEGMLDLLQAAEVADPAGSIREAIDLLFQASACFRVRGELGLSGVVHACLAAVYFCGNTPSGKQEGRGQRLVLTHCQHALDHLVDRGAPQLRLAVQLLEARALRRGPGGGGSRGGAAGRAGDAKAAVVLCDVALRCFQRPDAVREERTAAAARGTLEVDTTEEERALEEEDDWLRAAILASGEQELPLMTYLKQELSDLLLRLLRGNERNEGAGRELKALYCSLLTAWHADAGQAEALVALRAHARGMVDSTGH